MTALQDWLNIRPFDPRHHVKAVITALRGVDGQQTEAEDEPMLLRPGVERC